MTTAKRLTALLIVLATPCSYGAYDVIVVAGNTVDFKCKEASDSDCKVEDGKGKCESDDGFTYSWKAVWNYSPFANAGSFVNGDNIGRQVQWTAPTARMSHLSLKND